LMRKRESTTWMASEGYRDETPEPCFEWLSFATLAGYFGSRGSSGHEESTFRMRFMNEFGGMALP